MNAATFNLILRCAVLAEAAYRTDSVLCGRTGAACNVTYETGLGIVAAFRGSQSEEDFVHDAEAWLELLWEESDGREVRYHHGFYQDYLSIADDVAYQVNHLLALCPDAPVVIIGHSLGAAQAKACALDFRRGRNIRVSDVITFGEPRGGNSIFAEVYDACGLGEISISVVNQNDIVPRLPAWLAGFRRSGRRLFLPAWGGYVLNPSPARMVLSDLVGFGWAFRMRRDVLIREHFMAAYIAQLNKVKVTA